MALSRDLSAAQLAFQVADLDLDLFSVIRYRGREGLCQLYRFEIEVSTSEAEIQFDDVVGKNAVLSINTENGTRWFHGVVSRFEMIGETHELMYFRAELVPEVWLLTHRYNSRIFQNQAVNDIITDVLTKAGIPSDRYKFVLEQTYEPREYCVQYRETDYNFICRLMEEEGIWWAFEQTQDSHTLVMADSTSAYAPVEGEAELPYQAPTGMMVEEEHVFRFRLGQSVRPGSVVLRDFSFENPALDLQTKADAGRDTDLEFSDYPGEYVDQSRGSGLARTRTEEFESGRTRGVGQSNSCRLSPGLTFDLTEHPSEPANASYLLTSVTHEGKAATLRTAAPSANLAGALDAQALQSITAAGQSDNTTIRGLADALLQVVGRLRTGDPSASRSLTQWLFHAGQVARNPAATAAVSGGSPLEALTIPNLIDDVAALGLVEFEAAVYTCRFECIPAEVTYRPPRVTPWPSMRGTQTARVVGPSGEEIYTDEYGRVKVQFNWDREGEFDENASCWIRVSQGMAGGAYGHMFLPRVGQEVVIDFLEGDPDKPLIVGRVFNADHMPPYKLPDEKTKSVIKTHSSKGGGGCNEIRFEDLKDSEQLFIQAERQMDTRVKASHNHTVGGSYHLHIGGDESGEYRVYVETNKHTHVKAESRTHIEADESVEVDGKASIKVTGTRSTDVGGDVVDKFGANHKHEVTQTYALKALGVKIEASTAIELKCGGSSIVLTPAAIFVMGGPLVNINCGAGPPVGPVTAMATSPQAAEDPGVADESEPGKDTTYGGGEELPTAESTEEVAGHEFEPPEEEEEERETTWVDLELVDEEEEPVAGEKYIVTDSAGKEFKGTLDSNGKAHVTGIAIGEVSVSYPELDSGSWERT